VTGKKLENAHNSLHGCKVQCVVLFEKQFSPYLKNKSKSVSLIKDIWGSKAQNRAKFAAEPSWAAHKKWQADESAQTWWEMPQDKTRQKLCKFQGGCCQKSIFAPCPFLLFCLFFSLLDPAFAFPFLALVGLSSLSWGLGSLLFCITWLCQIPWLQLSCLPIPLQAFVLPGSNENE
jgi:hypothetical protein